MNKTNRTKLLHLILITIIILSVTIGIARCVPADEYIDGLKIFPDGIRIGIDPNNAFDPNGNITAKTLGLGVAKDPNYAIKSNGFTVDPNGNVGLGVDDNGYRLNVGYGGIFSTGYATNGGNFYALANENASTSIDSFVSVARYGAEAAYPVYYSGRLRFSSSAWDTSGAGSSKNHNWTIENRPVSGNPTSSSLWFSCDPGTGSYGDKVNFGSDGSISAAADTDTTFTFGRGKMGYGGALVPDNFMLSHYDHFSLTDYALIQDNTGSTYLNATAGFNLYLRNNNTDISTISSTGLTMAAGKTITLSGGGSIFSCNIEPTTNDTYYLGKNSTTSDQKAYKGVILKDTANTKTYRLEVTNGAVIATEIYTP